MFFVYSFLVQNLLPGFELRLQLPSSLHGPCMAGALARRLRLAPRRRALRALQLLQRRLQSGCLQRQAVNVARRNLRWYLGGQLGSQHEKRTS